ncbi:hypothetical protein COLO4_35338 [Corchorus olitorius]|uniref:Uncharacterized protein n=1 Tax=Corchorus olitorius TaxID=93759 RepID=A0A1R3GHE4_9ROSI|nr:hypothetical protein COLO4_35338 [Corchorus olitorius]
MAWKVLTLVDQEEVMGQAILLNQSMHYARIIIMNAFHLAAFWRQTTDRLKSGLKFQLRLRAFLLA